jgi:hypothetical protein
MSQTVTMIMEIVFNIAYLAAIWTLVMIMFRRYDRTAPGSRPVARWILVAFALLALGDTGHVGLRVVAYALGDLGTTFVLLGERLLLIGVGSFATAVTVTLFYGFMLLAWRARFHQRLGWFEWLLVAAAAVRLCILFFPQNGWNNPQTPYAWSLYRNFPLVVQGLGLAYLIFRDALKQHDRTFLWIAGMILVSYICYAPVILFVNRIPLLGMLMMPKTLAYLAVAFIAYFALYPRIKSALPPGHSLEPPAGI